MFSKDGSEVLLEGPFKSKAEAEAFRRGVFWANRQHERVGRTAGAPRLVREVFEENGKWFVAFEITVPVCIN